MVPHPSARPTSPLPALSLARGIPSAIGVLAVVVLLCSSPWGSFASPSQRSALASTPAPVTLLSSGAHGPLGSDRVAIAGLASGAVGPTVSARQLLPAWSYTNISVGTFASGAAFDDAAGTMLVGNVNTGASTVVLVNLASDTVVATTAVGNGPQAVAFDPSNGNFYVADWGLAGLEVISGTTGALLSTIPVACDPNGVVYDPANGDLYVSDMGSCAPATAEIDVVDPATAAVTATVPIGPYTAAPGGEIYAANLKEVVAVDADGNLSLIDPSTQTLTQNVRAFTPPVGSSSVVEQIAYDPSNDNVYTPNGAADQVAVVNLSTVLLTGVVGVGSTPWGAQYDPGSQQLLIANEFSGNATEIYGPSGLTVGSIPLGGYPTLMAFDATRNLLEVSNGADAELLTPSNAPTLNGVVITPGSQTLPIGSSFSFNAQPSCTGGSCPSSVNFTWSLSSAMGQLSSPWGSPVTFTAGTTAGSATLTVVASLQGHSSTAQAAITISATVPTLTAVQVTFQGSGSWLGLGGSEGVTAKPVCGTGTCPYGSQYVWALTNGLGALNQTVGGPLVGGPSIQLTSGYVPGVATLFLNVTLNGVKVAAPPSPLVYTVDRSYMAPDPLPDTSINGYGTSTQFSSKPSCAPNVCPGALTYGWSLHPSTLGTLSTATGNTTVFTAASTRGTGNMSLVVTFQQPYWGPGGSVPTFGFSWFANSSISVGPSVGNSSTTHVQGGLAFDLYLLILAGVVGVAAVVAALLLVRRKRSGKGATPSSPTPPSGGSWAPSSGGTGPAPQPPAQEPFTPPPPPPPLPPPTG